MGEKEQKRLGKATVLGSKFGGIHVTVSLGNH